MLIPVTPADGIVLDLRYATADNWTGAPIYRRPVALLRPEARDRLLDAAARARAIGLHLVVFDAFRPIEAQWALWHAAPDKQYAADPRGGGTHPRGVAVDLTLADGTGALPMGTGFDEAVPRSGHDCLDLPGEALRNRAILLGIMTAAGWERYGPEWWHYHLPDHGHLPVLEAVDGPM